MVALAETARELGRLDTEMRRGYDEGRSRGAPPLDRLPSRGRVAALVAVTGAARGLGFALVRPLLPRRPEAAALVYSTLAAAGLAAAVRGVHVAIAQESSQPVPLSRVVRAWAPTVLRRAAVAAALERWVERS